ncbi:MAG: hypothetical protein ACNS62_23035 [Candidatus Cyclobacteriaceae bacterium M3_2C_046]
MDEYINEYRRYPIAEAAHFFKTKLKDNAPKSQERVDAKSNFKTPLFEQQRSKLIYK